MSAPDFGEWADRYEDNHWFRAIVDAIARDEERIDRTRVAGGHPRLGDARKAQAIMAAVASVGGHVDSDSYRKLSVPERYQADAIALILQNGCGVYYGSDTDALTDASHIVLAARFAPPLGDNHHNAAACPYCTPPEPTGVCTCGHAKDKHIYGETGCRPGFRCDCRRYEEV